ncbi:MAG TPA: TPM domain-containing protein [Bacteroidales bacterium]|nr:TPM domain-containing protein [Bacteroidales bacterium]HSA44117.1 TPM domain-containing protein [Bacteroidales bacterium]
MPSARKFFSEQQQEDIRQAIMDAELDTSGEIRVHIEKSCTGDPYERAVWLFHRLGMQKTAARNAVLFYLGVENRKFAVVGDAGIHDKVGIDFWESLRSEMLLQFREGRFAEGLSNAIRLAGEQLKAHYPYKRDDINELKDDISFDQVH